VGARRRSDGEEGAGAGVCSVELRLSSRAPTDWNLEGETGERVERKRKKLLAGDERRGGGGCV